MLALMCLADFKDLMRSIKAPCFMRDPFWIASCFISLYIIVISFLASINFISSLFFCKIVVPTGRPTVFDLDKTVLLTLLRFDRRDPLALMEIVLGGSFSNTATSVSACLDQYFMKAFLVYSD